jgi:2-phosphosulfolactate phosphatase
MSIAFDLEFTPTGRASEAVVVFDVLRMTTTACAAFTAGVTSVVVVADPDDARAMARDSGAVLLGEREGVALPGFDGGNSPLEAMAMDLRGRSVVMCTTNGSRAALAAAGRHVLLGAIVNAAAVARSLVERAPSEVLLSCAGTAGRTSLDDVLGAACVLREVLALGTETRLSDACRLALRLVHGGDDLLTVVNEAAHARFLNGIGFADDVAFAARANSLDVVPARRGAAPPTFALGS